MSGSVHSFTAALALAGSLLSAAPADTSTWIGFNYTPAYAANQIQMWHEFKPEVIDRELAAAVEYFGINTLRVYLHNIVYDHEKDVFLERIEAFLRICDRHGIKPGFVFFDDCWNHSGITIDTAPPVDGRHNGRWAALQDSERKDENMCWELMVGNSNCRWYWGTQDGAPEPAIPWCGLLWPDCTPVSYAEAEAVRSYATGRRQSLLFEDLDRIAWFDDVVVLPAAHE